MKEKYKINLHIIEACNCQCKFCFAKFDSKKLLGFEDWKRIIDNCLNSEIKIQGFNIAGGEPLLHPDLIEIVKYIKSLNLFCSIQTNGLLINEEWIEENVKYFDVIGFSIDSFIPETIIKSGRIDKTGNFLDKDTFLKYTELIKRYNPDCKIKLNTVVSELNKNEIMLKFNNIDRWKVLKMRVFNNNKFSNRELDITDEEFENFIKNNSFIKNMIKENTVRSSYIIIDSNGFLIDNSEGDTHSLIANCIVEEFTKAFNKLNFNKDLYFSRYIY